MPRDGDLRALRLMNRQRVIDELVQNGPLTQAQVARSTGLSPATVSSIVRDLSEQGTLALAETGHAGRRGRTVKLAPDLGIVAGVDVGHRHLRVALARLDYTILAESSSELPQDHRLRDDLRLANTLIDELLSEQGLSRSSILRTGVGLPAPLDLTRRRLVTSVHLPQWDDVDEGVIREELDDVEIDNDANLGALGELIWGAAQGARNAIYIKLSTSIGAGLIVNGQLNHGERGTAGEIGHMTVEPNGRTCFCGSRGCLLTVVGAPALLEQVRHIHGADLTLERLLDLAEQGNRSCGRVLEDAGRHVGLVIATLCNVLNPARVVIGGTLTSKGNFILEAARASAERNALPFTLDHVEIVRAALGVRAEVHGAIALAIRAAASHGRLDRGPSEQVVLASGPGAPGGSGRQTHAKRLDGN